MKLKITTDLPGGDIDLLAGAVTDRFHGAEAVRLMQAGYAVVATAEDVAAAAAAADESAAPEAAAAPAAPRERRSRRSSPADQAEPGSAAPPPANPAETLSEG